MPTMVASIRANPRTNARASSSENCGLPCSQQVILPDAEPSVRVIVWGVGVIGRDVWDRDPYEVTVVPVATSFWFLCRLMCTKNKNPSHTSVHVCHTRRVPHLTRYKCLPPLTRIPRSLLGDIPRLGLDRAYGRRFVALIFVLFRDSFKAILPFFWWSPPLGRATGLSDVCDPITPVGFWPAWRPTDAKCQFEGP